MVDISCFCPQLHLGSAGNQGTRLLGGSWGEWKGVPSWLEGWDWEELQTAQDHLPGLHRPLKVELVVFFAVPGSGARPCTMV